MILSKTLIRQAFYVNSLILLVSCNDSSSSNESDEGIPARPGREQTTVALQYIDSLPSLSDDGAKLAFLAGSSAKIVDLTNETSTPEPVGNDSQHYRVLLSGDGSHVLLATVSNSSFNLLVIDLANRSNIVTVTTSDTKLTDIVFSPDGAIAAWSKGTSLQISHGKEVDVKTPANGSNHIPLALDKNEDGSYVLYTKSTIEGLTLLYSWSFTEPGQTDELNPVVISDNGFASVDLAIGMDQILVSVPTSDLTTKVTTTAEDVDLDVQVASQLKFLNSADGTFGTTTTFGSRQVALVSNPRSSLYAGIANFVYRCTSSDSVTFGFWPFIGTLGESPKAIIPVFHQENQGWEMRYASTTCEESALTEPLVYDITATQIHLNGSATADDWVMALQTSIKGDPEIVIMKKSGGSVSVRNVSNNSPE